MSDLFDFFKENEHKLHETPPDKVWERLEERLEKRPKRRKPRAVPFMQWTVVILILALLLLAAVMVWFFAKNG